jgi:hypothetical protein
MANDSKLKPTFVDPYHGQLVRPHPAKFSKQLIPYMRDLIPTDITILCDPMAGVGRIDQLGDKFTYHLNEIEPEWANQIDSKHTVTIGDACDYTLPANCMVVTSPPYGNRMADYFVSPTRPESMKGRYAGALGHRLSDGSAASMKFGNKYQETMTTCYEHIFSQMQTDQLFLLNISNFIALYKEVNVCGFYLDMFTRNGYTLDNMTPVTTPRNTYGANGSLRVAHEALMLWRKL